MLDGLHRRLSYYHRRDRIPQCGQTEIMQLVPRNPERTRHALSRIEQISDHRDCLIAHPFEHLRRSLFAQQKHRGNLETGIDGTLHPPQVPGALKRGQKAAHALIAHVQ
jgi:hypothetical protein